MLENIFEKCLENSLNVALYFNKAHAETNSTEFLSLAALSIYGDCPLN